MRHPQRKQPNVTYWRPKEMLKNAPFSMSKPADSATATTITNAAPPAKTA